MNVAQIVEKQKELLNEQSLEEQEERLSAGNQIADAARETESARLAARKTEIRDVTDAFAAAYEEAWDTKDLHASVSITMPDLKYRLSDFTSLTDGDKHSGAAVELGNCIREMKELTRDDTAKPSIEDSVEKLFELSLAADSYRDSHRGRKWTYGGSARYAAAKKLRRMTHDCLRRLVTQEEEERINSNENADFVMGESMKSVTKDLERAAKAYKKFAARIANDCQAYTPQEILNRKMQALRLNERKIKLYRMQYPDIAQRDADIQEMIEAYEEGLRWETIRTFTKKQDEKGSSLSEMIEKHVEKEGELPHREKLSFADPNEGLEEEQVQGIEAIDNWLIRNFQNGGLAGAALSVVKNAHEDFVTALLSLTKRERLHIYYLVETGRRKNPGIVDVGASQAAVYKPDLETFKDQMLATKWKFWTRVTGGYTYMGKLSQAFQQTMNWRKEILSLSGLAAEKKELTDRIAENREGPQAAGAAEKRLEKMIILKGALEEYCRNLQAAGKATGKKKTAEEAKCREAAMFCQDLLKELVILDNEVGKVQVADPKAERVTDTTKTGGSMYATVVSVPSMVHGGVSAVSNLCGGSWQLESAGWDRLNLWGGSIAGAAGCAASLVGAVTTFLSMRNDWGQLSAEDRSESILTILGSVTSAVSNVNSVKGLVETAGSIAENVTVSASTETVGTIASEAGSAISAGIAVAKTVGTSRMLYHGKNAQEVFLKKRKKAALENELYGGLSKEKKRELKYEENMMKLQADLTKRDAKNTAYAWADAGLSVAGLFIPGIGVVRAGFSVVTGILDSIEVTGIRTRLFDSFFKMDSLVERAMASKEAQRLLRLPDTKSVGKGSFTAALRKRVAACAGFCDVHAAALDICTKFARLVRGKLFGGQAESEEDKKGYKEFVRSLKLTYNEQKEYPGENILVRKLSAR